MNRKALFAARRGAKYLDKQLGRGWRRKIRRRKLDLASGCNCIVGQLHGGHYTPEAIGVESFTEQARLGFEAYYDEYEYDDLTEAWLEVLRDKPKVPA